jgi:hypothetical protein
LVIGNTSDWPPHIDQRQHWKVSRSQSLMFARRVSGAECGKMNADVASEPLGELPRKRRIARRDEYLDIASLEHRTSVSRPGGNGFALDTVRLDGEWRETEAAAFKCFCGGLYCRREMRDVIEEHLPPPRHLPCHWLPFA